MSSANNNQNNGLDLCQKKFIHRNSVLIEKYKQNDFRAIYNFFLIILISLCTNTVVHDYLQHEKWNFGLRLIGVGFNNFHMVIIIWLVLVFKYFLIYLVFQLWAKIYVKFKWQSTRLWIILPITYIGITLYICQKLVIANEFKACSSVVVLLESVRILMKEYSFIRLNAARVMDRKKYDDLPPLPTFGQCAYFFFAPTLIYRDEYPRNDQTNWWLVFSYVLEMFGVLLMLSFIVERTLVPYHKDFGLRTYSKVEIILLTCGNLFPGIIFLFCAFYSVLHISQNFFAEILRFADRQFYTDWWTCRSISEYYRMFNEVVYDWLHTFIYRDIYLNLLPGNKLIAKWAVLVVSAFIHEWVIVNALGLFLPIQSSQFLVGDVILTVFRLKKSRLSNLVMLYCIVLGCGMQVNMYTMEFFSRLNCPINETHWYDFFWPRFVSCLKIE